MSDTAEMPQAEQEVIQKFIPTPERVSQFLELDHNEVSAKLQSVEGRQAILDQLMEHEADLMEIDPTFDPAELREDLDMVGETLGQKEKFLQASESPEKKGLFRRAFDRIKGFAKKHPVVTALLCAAALAGTVAGGYYVWANWELLLQQFGVAEFVGAGEAAADSFSPIAPAPVPLPDGGLLDVPLPPGVDPGV